MTVFEDKTCKVVLHSCNDDILSVVHRGHSTFVTVLSSGERAAVYRVGHGDYKSDYTLAFTFTQLPEIWEAADVEGKSILYRSISKGVPCLFMNIKNMSPHDSLYFAQYREWAQNVNGPWYPCDKQHIPV